MLMYCKTAQYLHKIEVADGLNVGRRQMYESKIMSKIVA
jgi:hypothetical protein